MTGSVAAGVDLAGRGLDEVGAGGHGQDRGATDVVERLELAGLEDHLEVRLAAGLLDRDDLVEDRAVVAGQEGAAVDDHVDLVGARLDRRRVLGELDRPGTSGPTGTPVATLATFTVEPLSASFASAMSAG